MICSEKLAETFNPISFKDFQELSSNPDFQILDTRSTSKYEESHIPNSINVPLNSKFAIFAASCLDFNKEILVICEEGTDQEVAIRLMRTGLEK